MGYRVKSARLTIFKVAEFAFFIDVWFVFVRAGKDACRSDDIVVSQGKGKGEG